MLALFITTAAVVAITTQDAKDTTPSGTVAQSNLMIDQIAALSPPGSRVTDPGQAAPAAALAARLADVAAFAPPARTGKPFAIKDGMLDPFVRFAQDENTHGRFPGGGSTIRFPREAGWGNAMRYMLTGEHWGAEEAYRMGVIQEIAGSSAPRTSSRAARLRQRDVPPSTKASRQARVPRPSMAADGFKQASARPTHAWCSPP